MLIAHVTVVIRLLDSSVLSLKKRWISSQIANKWLSLQKQKSTKSWVSLEGD